MRVAGRDLSGVRVALIVALGGLAIALAGVLSGSPPSVARANAPLADFTKLDTIVSSTRVCQGGEVLPRDVTAVRISLEALIGPPLTLTASSGTRVLTGGRRGAGWSTGSVTIPVRPVTRTQSHVTVCAQVAEPHEPVNVDGVSTSPARSAREGSHHAVGGRLMIEYLRPGDTSWWSRAESVARRMGLGRAGAGTWIALLAAAVMLTLTTLMSWLLVRELA